MSTTINGTDNSAAAPALVGSDTDTGVFFPAANTTAFSNGGAESMRIDSSGNVGIGTTSPSAKLDITNGRAWFTANSEGYGIYMRYNSSTNGCFIGSPAADSFAVYNAGGSERMRINSSGQLLINQTSSLFGRERIAVYSTTSEGYTSQIEDTTYGQMSLKSINAGASTHYMIQFRTSANSVVGQITHNDSGTAYTTTSDYRLKENVAPMQNALNVVQQLKPVTYTWKSDGSDGQGFIAHELAEVVPDCVTGEKDAVDADGNPQYQGIDTSFLVATLTAAIQELNAKVDAQAAEITQLKAK